MADPVAQRLLLAKVVHEAMCNRKSCHTTPDQLDQWIADELLARGVRVIEDKK